MIDAFRQRFGGQTPVHVYCAPGRVNLIGEHTDYNLGFVLPVALDMACYVAAGPSSGTQLRVWSEHRQEEREWHVPDIAQLQPARDWSDYLIGVAQELIRAGYAIEPRNLLIRSTVPEGSGLSSSAALEVSCALALLGGRPIDPLELAQLCRRAEGAFVGMPCGIMDQYISIYGQEHAAIRIDCRSLEHEVVALPQDAAFLAVNSMVKHALASSAYKQRTVECAAAAEAMHVASLRDTTLEMSAHADLPEPIARRARHVISENVRVEAFVAACRKGDLPRMGSLFVESHRSLRDDYEVSCAELDFLVDSAIAIPGVYGARMTGGGFGGCTVNLMRPEALSAFSEQIGRAYRERFGIPPQIYPCRPSRGAHEVKNPESIPPSE